MSAQKLITEHLDLWTGAITKKSTSGRGSNGKIELTGVKKLRALILQLAINGKLVEQNEHDETAKSLLSRVAESQAALIASGMLKKKKKLPPVTADDCYTVIPMGWEPVRLGDILDRISNGFGGKQTKTGSGLPLTRIETISDGTINPEKLGYSTEIPNEKQEYFKLQAGDILFSHINSDLHIGKTAIIPSNIEIYHGVNLLLLRPSELVSSRFIAIVINALRLDGYFLNIAQHAIGQASVNQSKVNNIAFALPPAEEQHRIVQKVDELMTLYDRLEQQTSDQLKAHDTLVETLLGTLTQSKNATELSDNWARLSAHFDTLFTTEKSIDKLKQAILQLAVMGRLVEQDTWDEPVEQLLKTVDLEVERRIHETTIKKPKTLGGIDGSIPYELPKGWRWEKLGRFTLIGTGATPSRERPDYYSPSEYPWVSSGETSQAFICDTKERVSSLAVKETNISIYPVGTLIVAMYGQGKTRGQVSELKVAAGTNQACAAIQPLINDVSHRRYIKLCFIKLYDEIRKNAAGGAQPNLNTGKIANTLIPLPPLAEQHRIVQKVEELMALCDQLKERLYQAGQTRCQLAEAVVKEAVA